MSSDLRNMLRTARVYLHWLRSGRPIPPPDQLKRETLRWYGRRFNLSTFIETGTYKGETIEALKRKFNRLYSIELDPQLYVRARNRFAHDTHVAILEGDSSERLPEILSLVRTPALVWLDGHYSGGPTAKGALETPIRRELELLFGSGVDHVVLIDDARCFDGTHDYPTLADLQAYVRQHKPGWTYSVSQDIIRIHP